jgi:hypothetical protein
MNVLPKVLILVSLLSAVIVSSEAFGIEVSRNQVHKLSLSASPSPTDEPVPIEKKKDNKAMAFLRKVGKVGGEANHDYTYAVGVDEGPTERTDDVEGAKVRSMPGLVADPSEKKIVSRRLAWSDSLGSKKDYKCLPILLCNRCGG